MEGEKRRLRILAIGAHPDDCDGGCGGAAIKWSGAGHAVGFVSMTDGGAGHQSFGRKKLGRIRKKEAQAAARVAGIGYRILGYPDGEMEATLEARKTVIRVIREFNPDLILTHRPNDYHPDHRCASRLVLDASYLVMVPNVCSGVPILRHQPAIFYFSDEFRKPNPFTADIAVAVDDVIAQKLEMVSCHRSQYFDWLPWIAHLQGGIPADFDDDSYAESSVKTGGCEVADRCRAALLARYGSEAGASVRYAEAFELSEYGSAVPRREMDRLFPL